MAKKIFMVAFAIIVLCLCCGSCFAAENNGSSTNLGNEIMDSIDKTGKSVDNVVSGNIVKDAGNTVRNAGKDVKDGVNDAGRDTKNAVDGVVGGANGMYNTTRTTAEGTTTNGAFSSMTTTTWMWIILVVAAIVIIAAIWYYATRTND